MTRENVKKNMDIISAFAGGKTIQILNERGEWEDLIEREGLPMGILEETPDIFRIKPELKYRPFANAEECWAEMQKHHPFGWVKHKGFRINIANVMSKAITFADNEARDVNYEQAFKNYTFADGLPFGVKVEE